MAIMYDYFETNDEYFFTRVSATRLWCNQAAQKLANVASGQIIPAPVQGLCSYTVHCGADIVVQFRPKSLALDPEVCELARRIHQPLAAWVQYHGEAGADGRGQPVLVFSMQRLHGTAYIRFKATHYWDPRSAQTWRANIMRDVARYVEAYYSPHL